jgi:hypothetical protein
MSKMPSTFAAVVLHILLSLLKFYSLILIVSTYSTLFSNLKMQAHLLFTSVHKVSAGSMTAQCYTHPICCCAVSRKETVEFPWLPP